MGLEALVFCVVCWIDALVAQKRPTKVLEYLEQRSNTPVSTCRASLLAARAMGKNKGKGGKSFRSGKKDRTDTRRALVYKETFAEEEGADGAPQVCKSHMTLR